MDDKRLFLTRFMQDHPDSKVIVFVRTKVRAERVLKVLERVAIDAVSIHGDKDQKERAEAMQKFRAGDCRILIATDISARGIDVPDVDYVINYDLPEKAENYVHRVGRTGRGVNKGEAISFCSTEEKPLLDEIQTFLDKPVAEMKVSKAGYAEVVKASEVAKQDLRALVGEHDAWLSKKTKKRKKK